MQNYTNVSRYTSLLHSLPSYSVSQPNILRFSYITVSTSLPAIQTLDSQPLSQKMTLELLDDSWLSLPSQNILFPCPSLRSGDPRILSAVLVCLLSQKHIHPMVSVNHSRHIFQWTLLFRLGILSRHSAPQTPAMMTPLSSRSGLWTT